MTDQRAAFEAWAKQQYVSTKREVNGLYQDPAIQFCWQAWQAAIEHAKEREA